MTMNDANQSPPASPQTPEEVQAQQNQAQAQQNAATEEAATRGEAAAERPSDTEPNADPFGMSMRGAREVGGGAIVKELRADPPTDSTIDAAYYHRRYNGSRLAKEAGHLIARSAENIGFWGKGHTYHGNGGILVNIDTLEKVRVQDGYRFEGDEVFANSRDLPPSLVEGDIQKNLSGASAQNIDDFRRSALVNR